jgi:hypothetical protein
VPRISDFLCNWKMEKRFSTDLYFTATKASCVTASIQAF